MYRLPFMPLGNRIRYYREKAGWTLDQLSDRCGVDVGTISALENRNSQRSKYAVKIASGFGLTLNQLEDEATDYDVPVEQIPDLIANQKPASYSPKLSDDEALLLQAFRAASEETRAAMLAFAKSVLPDRNNFGLRTGND